MFFYVCVGGVHFKSESHVGFCFLKVFQSFSNVTMKAA
jgi:hypothetical protein